MTDFVVHSIPGSPFGRAVLATLEQKGASYRFEAVVPGTLREEAHLARHPFGRVPVLDHGDFRLYEVQAILRYLDRVLPGPALTPADPRAAARMDQALNISDWYLFQGCSNIIAFQRVVGPRLMGLTPDETAIAAAMPRAHQVFAELSRLLGDQTHFAGEALSLADLMLAAQIDFLAMTPEWAELTAARPNLVAWLGRMNALPALAATTWDEVARMAQAA
ncbi:MAG: glutathione S-transferase family protein [Alphaproteobacteria bacterium]|nr:glutathione S-transferase family protein [Alphaproteobacteria bacterium]